jgi:hypothetical protein
MVVVKHIPIQHHQLLIMDLETIIFLVQIVFKEITQVLIIIILMMFIKIQVKRALLLLLIQIHTMINLKHYRIK